MLLQHMPPALPLHISYSFISYFHYLSIYLSWHTEYVYSPVTVNCPVAILLLGLVQCHKDGLPPVFQYLNPFPCWNTYLKTSYFNISAVCHKCQGLYLLFSLLPLVSPFSTSPRLQMPYNKLYSCISTLPPTLIHQIQNASFMPPLSPHNFS